MLIKPTRYPVNVVSPRASFAVPTSIGPSVLSVGHVSSRTGSTPSLVLNSEDSVTKPQSNQSTFQDGVCSSPIESRHQWIATIHLWNGSVTSVFVASEWLGCKQRKKNHENGIRYYFYATINWKVILKSTAPFSKVALLKADESIGIQVAGYILDAAELSHNSCKSRNLVTRNATFCCVTSYRGYRYCNFVHNLSHNDVPGRKKCLVYTSAVVTIKGTEVPLSSTHWGRHHLDLCPKMQTLIKTPFSPWSNAYPNEKNLRGSKSPSREASSFHALVSRVITHWLIFARTH